MLKVLIADDEIVICQMIKKLVNWGDKGLELVGMAHNGYEVIEMMTEFRPDIVITDIRMPGFDGLQLVQKGIEMGLNADYIIMSGYKNFEYAHTALNLGVKYYILKPIEQKELNEIIDRVLNERRESQILEFEKKNLEERVVTGKLKIRKHFLSSIIQQNNMGNIIKNEEIEVTADCEFRNGCFVAFLSKLDSEIPVPDMQNLLSILDYQIEKKLESEGCEYINSYVKSGVVTVLNYVQDDREKIKEVIERIYKQCRQELDKFDGYHLTIGVGSEKESISDVQKSILEAVEAVKCRMKKGTDCTIYWDSLKFLKRDEEELFSAKTRIIFENEGEVLDHQAFCYDFGILLDKVKSLGLYSPAQIFELIETVSAWIASVWRKNKISEKLVEEYEQKIQYIIDCNYKEELLIFGFRELMKQFFERVKEEKKNASQLPIRLAKQYMNQNYKNSITLEEVAEAISLSPTYLSTLFKKEIGIGFSEYLISCRMEEAKRLLKSSNLSVNLIAEEVGYLDPKYFSKTFSKVVGLKPSEYRRLYQ